MSYVLRPGQKPPPQPTASAAAASETSAAAAAAAAMSPCYSKYTLAEYRTMALREPAAPQPQPTQQNASTAAVEARPQQQSLLLTALNHDLLMLIMCSADSYKGLCALRLTCRYLNAAYRAHCGHLHAHLHASCTRSTAVRFMCFFWNLPPGAHVPANMADLAWLKLYKRFIYFCEKQDKK